jgi:hypothetical protein
MTRDEITARVRRGFDVTRAEAGLPPCAEIAEKAGLGSRTVARIHAGTTIESLVRIAAAMDRAPAAILREFEAKEHLR